jgi:uncharacterized protein (TIGR02246 family)
MTAVLSTDDILAIQQLAASYNHAVDSGDGPGFAGTFTSDGILEAGGNTIKGQDALAEFATNVPSGLPCPRHVATNLLIEGSGDEASLRAYVHVYILKGEPPTATVATSGRYEDQLLRIDGEWRFARRVFTPDALP